MTELAIKKKFAHMSDLPVPDMYKSKRAINITHLKDGGVLYTVPHRITKIVVGNIIGPKPVGQTRMQKMWGELTSRFADERWEYLGLPEFVDVLRQRPATRPRTAATTKPE